MIPMTIKESSDLSISRRECPTCGAIWLNGQHRWATGAVGNDLDLAGLVCNQLDESKECINLFRGQRGGDTWEKRVGVMEWHEKEIAKTNAERDQ